MKENISSKKLINICKMTFYETLNNGRVFRACWRLPGKMSLVVLISLLKASISIVWWGVFTLALWEHTRQRTEGKVFRKWKHHAWRLWEKCNHWIHKHTPGWCTLEWKWGWRLGRVRVAEEAGVTFQLQNPRTHARNRSQHPARGLLPRTPAGFPWDVLNPTAAWVVSRKYNRSS